MRLATLDSSAKKPQNDIGSFFVIDSGDEDRLLTPFVSAQDNISNLTFAITKKPPEIDSDGYLKRN
ncbi:hypothetical protein Ctha_1958 [Chloroherpeton thalassium ATCC 35110]|uniref:Uncharacterized protein n=1 Tax=Chloroherpeton thalassium (strain ATCC 35110 / GB-78) TaxID=517418 RepID=B3QUG3_CHLT3|nr:hypothetical protein [Chloroherpeton thalassium]ACF14412.1 hypothetical protein Ctha_1958 [Chloroherpeton thalassium ATCC 35110]